MLMAQSLFKAIKAHHASAVIDVVALDWTKALLSRMPEVNKAITLPTHHGVFGWNMRKKLGIKLRSQCYDQAIILPNSWKSALVPWFANIPIRTGWRGEMRYGLINDIRVLNTSALPMMVQRYVSLAYPKNQSHIAPSYDSPCITAKPISPNFKLPSSHRQKRLIFCPGAAFGPAKQWPASHYAQLANTLLAQNWQLIILGSQSDDAIASRINSDIQPMYLSSVFNLCGKTALTDAIDLLASADIVVSNDSGLMHIAAALQRPLIAIYGPTSPNFTPPLADCAHIVQLQVDCGPCFQRICPKQHHRCMQHISSEYIADLIKSNTSCIT